MTTQPKKRGRPAKAQPKTLQADSQFAQFDADGDGVVSDAELMAAERAAELKAKIERWRNEERGRKEQGADRHDGGFHLVVPGVVDCGQVTAPAGNWRPSEVMVESPPRLSVVRSR